MKAMRNFDPADLIGEGVRVLKRLAVPGSRLEKREDFYALTGTGRAGRSLHVPQTMVDAFARRDWLTRTSDGAFGLSNLGVAWLRRALAGEDPDLAPNEPPAPVEELKVPVVNEEESPLATMRVQTGTDNKPLIDDIQFAAGDRLRRDFTLANLMPRMTVDLTAPVVNGRHGATPANLSDIAVAARQRFGRATAALGNDLANVAIDVCCYLKPLTAAESTQGWPSSAALVVLRLALDRLAHHYGIPLKGTGGRTRAWRAAGEGDDTGNED